jgi:hypothetical protein
MPELAGDIFGPVDFETGDFSQFSIIDNSGNIKMEVSTGSAAHDTYGMQIVYDGVNSLLSRFLTVARNG